MAVVERRTGGNGFLYFAVGALIVAVAGLAWFLYTGGVHPSSPETAVERAADSVSDAARNIGDTAKSTASRAAPAPQQ